MSEWRIVTVAEVAQSVTVGHVGSMASEYVKNGVPFLRSQNVRAGRLELTNVKSISVEFHRKLAKSQLRASDIVMVRTGTPGAAALIPDGLGELNCSDLVIIRPGADVDPSFLCYAINATAADFISAHLVGAVQQHFNVGSAKRLPIKLPPLAIQRAVVKVLGALDDKIAINEHIIANSNQLCEAVFASALSNSQRRSLSSVATPILGGTPDRADQRYWDGSIPWASAKDVAGCCGGILIETEESVTELAAQNTKAKPVPRGSVLLTARGTLGAVARVGQETALNQSCYAFVPGRLPAAVLYMTIRYASQQLLGLAHGSVFSTVNMATFDRVAVPTFDASSMYSLERRLIPFLDCVESNTQENAALARLRDTLLPELVSGELRVRDAAQIVGDVV